MSESYSGGLLYSPSKEIYHEREIVFIKDGHKYRAGGLEVDEFTLMTFARADCQRLFLVGFVVLLIGPGNERGGDRLAVDGDEVHLFEPSVLFDVLDAGLEIAEATRQIHLKQVLQQVFEIDGEMVGKAHAARDDLLVDLNRLIGEERRVAGAHFVLEERSANVDTSRGLTIKTPKAQ